MRAYLLRSLLIVSVAAMGCGDGKPSTDARDGARDGMGDGSVSNDRADVGGDKPANGGNGGSTTGSAGTGGDAGTGTGGSAGSAGTGGATGGASGNDGGAGAGADGGGNDGAAPTCNDGIKNSDETGIDCGGHCGKCGPGDTCLVNTDCQYACRVNKTCAACNVAADCPGIESECEHRTCTAGACGSTRETAGTVLAVQSTGDCKRRQCATDGTVATVNDDTDVPDDRNACTNDLCATGAPSHTTMPANSNCGGANHCDATGQCIGCTVATDCPGSDTACRTRTCTSGGVCGFSFAASATKLVDPTAGDCKGLQCDGKGNEQVYNDSADIPVDNNVCTTDECSSGTPSHRPVASGTTCGGSLVCDGASKCVECLSASTCAGTDAECHTRSCMSGECGVANMAMGTLVAAQTPRDCKKNVCNGQGGVTTVNDDLDLPVDSNACTFDVCTAGTPTNPNVTAGNSCGNNTICDGQGACVTCLTASACPGTDTDCHHRTCTNGVCGVANAAAGMALPTQTAGDCKRSQCDGSGGSMIVNDDGDKPVDGNACTDDVCTAGAPSNPILSTGTTCGTNLMCNAQGACVGCITAANCGTDTTCQKHTCSAAGVCGVTNAPVGTPLPAQNQTARDCKRVQCDGQGQSTTVNDDTDTPVDGNACTKDLCNAGQTSNPPEDSGTACSQGNGTKCNGNGTTPACVQCLQPSDCGGTDTDCHHRTCTNGVCGIANTTDGTGVAPQIDGDCKKRICMGGAEVAANDDTDLPVDGKACTNDLCMGGAPSHTPVGINMSCNEDGGTRCNGAGACVVCTQNSHCGNTTFCQTFTCSLTGQCVTTPTANGTPLDSASQTAGDCLVRVCNGNGVDIPAADDTDVPNDGNDCTVDQCSSGVVQHLPRAANDPCNQSNGTRCNGSATAPACVQCLVKTDCGTDTACKKFSCTAGLCGSTNTDDGTDVDNTPVGNCHKNVCMGGLITPIVDDNDLPVDGNPCTNDVCTNGAMSNPFRAQGDVCGDMLLCDATGHCVGCLSDRNCPLPTSACQDRICTNNVCGFSNKLVGTILNASDKDGNCQHTECAANGVEQTVDDDNDVPTNTNECVTLSCASGNPVTTNKTIRTKCAQNMGMECDGFGQCVGCINASECGADDLCFTRTCDLGVCGVAFKLAGIMTTDQHSGNCKLNVCDGAGNAVDMTDSGDVPDNLNVCTATSCVADVPTTTNLPRGTACSKNGKTWPGLTCDGQTTCQTTFSIVRLGADAPTATALTSAAAPVTIEERKIDGTTVVRTTALPATGAGNLFTNSGSAASEGSLSLSGNGRYLILAGYNTASATPAVASAASVNRVVARVDAAGTADISTQISQTAAFTAANVRSATSNDGLGFWVSGQGTGSPANGGVWWVPLGGGTGPTQIMMSPQPLNTRWVHAIDGQLYVSAASGSFNSVYTVGTGLPTTSGQSAMALPGMPTANQSPYSYVFLNRNGGSAFDLLYVSDDGNTANQGIQKWTFNGSSWSRSLTTYNVSPAVDFKGVTGFVDDTGTVTLFATTDENASRIVKIVETFGTSPGATVTPISGFPPANQVYRGVAMSPHL